MVQKTFQSLHYELQPAPLEISDLVDSCWLMHNQGPAAQPFTVLPDGVFKTVLVRQPGQAPQLTLSGIWTHAFEMSVPAQGTVMGIRFKLLAAPALALAPLPCNEARPLPRAGWLAALLQASPDLRTLSQGLVSKLATVAREPHQQALFRALEQSAGTWPVAQLAGATGWPPRRLNRYFQARFGLPVKAYASVLRSYAAVQQLRRGDLSAIDGFCDQSHGIREIKKHTGASPRQLDKQRHDRFIQLCPPDAPDLRPS